MAEYVVNIDGMDPMSEEITKVVFESKIPDTSNVRSANLSVKLTLEGKISLSSKKLTMVNNTKAIAAWSLLKPSLADSYKKVTVEYMHAEGPRKYELPDAFVISYTETFGATDGTFILVLKQKEDMTEDVTIS